MLKEVWSINDSSGILIKSLSFIWLNRNQFKVLHDFDTVYRVEQGYDFKFPVPFLLYDKDYDNH